ncbi:unnamed protein product [Caenorhabditis nigoni]
MPRLDQRASPDSSSNESMPRLEADGEEEAAMGEEGDQTIRGGVRKMLEEVKATAKSEMIKEDKLIRILNTCPKARQNQEHELTATKVVTI